MICEHWFTAAKSMKIKFWKWYKWSSKEWIKKIYICIYIYIYEQLVGKLMQLQTTMPSEIHQTQEVKYCIISLIWKFPNIKNLKGGIIGKRLQETWALTVELGRRPGRRGRQEGEEEVDMIKGHLEHALISKISITIIILKHTNCHFEIKISFKVCFYSYIIENVFTFLL